MKEIYDVFISYRRSDGRELAERLHAFLESKGLRVFLDTKKLKDGEYFDTQLRNNLITAPHYVLIGTSDAFARRDDREDWVWKEIELAISEFDKAPQERTIAVLKEKDAVISEKLDKSLPQKTDRIQRIPVESGGEETAFGRVLNLTAKVSRMNLWYAAHRWLENSKMPCGRFANLHIEKTILPNARQKERRSELPIDVLIDKDDGKARGEEARDQDENREIVPLCEALAGTEGHLYLIGEGGIGKTTALMRIMEDAYCEKEYEERTQIPIFVELSFAPDADGRLYEKGESTFILRSIYKQLIDRNTESRGTVAGRDELDEVFKMDPKVAVEPVRSLFTGKTPAPEYLLLLDGLNEVSTAKIKNSTDTVLDLVRAEIRYLIENCPNVRVILTSRSDDSAIDFENVKTIRLAGVDNAHIKSYLQSCKLPEEKITAALSNAGLNRTLRIPLFLTMYASLRNADEVFTQGEILHAFFHERRENVGVYTMQGRIAAVGNNFVRSENAVEDVRLNADMQNFILDLVVPQIAYEMQKEEAFYFSPIDLCDPIMKILKGRGITDECGFCGRDVFPVVGKNRAKKSPAAIADDILKVFGGNEDGVCEAILECLVNALGVLQVTNGEYGFVHQHIRDYFAAVKYIGALKLAVFLYKSKKREEALPLLVSCFGERPVSLRVRRFIGEALGEYRNKPVCRDCGWISGVPSEPCDRNLIARALEICRGRDRAEYGSTVYNLIHILHAVRGDLSGCDLSRLDFTGCSLNGMILGRKGLPALLDGARLNGENLMYCGHTGEICSAAFSPDDRCILTAGDSTVRIWDAESFELLKTFDGFKGVQSAVYSPSGEQILVIFRNGRCLSVIRAEDGERIGTVDEERFNKQNGESAQPGRYNRLFTDAQYGKDGKMIVISSLNGRVYVYDAQTLEPVGRMTEVEKHAEDVSALVRSACFFPDGSRILTVSLTGKFRNARSYVRIRDAGHLSSADTVVECDGMAEALCAPDGRAVLVSSGGGVFLYDAGAGHRLIKKLSDKRDMAAFSPDARRLAMRSGLRLSVLNVSRGFTPEKTCKLDVTGRLSWSHGGKRILLKGRDSVRVLNAETLETAGRIRGYKRRRGGCCSFSPAGDLFAVSVRSDVSVFDGNGVMIGNLAHPYYSYGGIPFSFSPDGTRVVTLLDRIRVWDVERQTVLCEIPYRLREGFLTGEHARGTVSFSPDGTKILYDFGGVCEVFDARDAKKLGEIVLCAKEDLDRYAFSGTAAFSSDGSCLLTVAPDGSAQFLDADGFGLLRTAAAPVKGARSVHFLPDRRRIVIDVKGAAHEEGALWKGSEPDQLLFYDLEREEVVLRIEDQRAAVLGQDETVSFHPDGVHMLVASFGCLYLWDLREGCVYEHRYRERDCDDALFSADGRRILVSLSDGTAEILDARTFECIRSIPKVPGLNVVGVDFTRLDPRSAFTDEEKEIIRVYGGIV